MSRHDCRVIFAGLAAQQSPNVTYRSLEVQVENQLNQLAAMQEPSVIIPANYIHDPSRRKEIHDSGNDFKDYADETIQSMVRYSCLIFHVLFLMNYSWRLYETPQIQP